jgi:ATP synthase subunit 6
MILSPMWGVFNRSLGGLRFVLRKGLNLILGFSIFLILALLNLLSLVVFSYPVTTTLSFNLRLALILWLIRIIIFLFKVRPISMLLLPGTPWYLCRFLVLVELIRIRVRPITLTFRLLANIRAGHVLLSLICKLTYGTWVLGALFGLLELMVCLIQAFVFLILVNVYLAEGYTHFTLSLKHSFEAAKIERHFLIAWLLLFYYFPCLLEFGNGINPCYYLLC